MKTKTNTCDCCGEARDHADLYRIDDEHQDEYYFVCKECF